MNKEVLDVVSIIIEDESFDILKYYNNEEIIHILNYLGRIRKYDLLMSYLDNKNNRFRNLALDIIENSYNSYYLYLIGVYGYEIDYDKLTRMMIKTQDINYLQKYLQLDIGVFNKMAVIECVLQDGNLSISKANCVSCLFKIDEEYLDTALEEGLISSLIRVNLSRVTLEYLFSINKKYQDALMIYYPFINSKEEYSNFLFLDDVYKTKKSIKSRKRELN